jgi:uncharacterized caspase-like protein
MRSPTAFLFAVLLLLSSGPAWADKRVALVIGNSAYQNVPRLSNAANDAKAVADLLERAGFEVVESNRDLDNAGMRNTLREFSDKARDADMAVVYYAGHGIEIDGQNYLVPTDAALARDSDAADEAVALDRVLQVIEPAKRLRLVILDACGDNPFTKTMRRSLSSRALGKGLAALEPGKPDTLIAFAARGGSTSDDGAGGNSPFATALLKHLTTPGLDMHRAFSRVRDEVMKATGNRQEPFVYGVYSGATLMLVPLAPAQIAATLAANPQADGSRALLDKAAADAARVATTGTATRSEPDKAGVPSEGAKTAEKPRPVDPAKIDANDLMRLAVERASAERIAREAARVKADAEARAAQAEARAATGKPAQVAALPADAGKTGLTPQEISRSLQTELRRVGCQTAAVSDEWTPASRRSLDLFNKHANTWFDTRLASLDALDAVKGMQARICR